MARPLQPEVIEHIKRREGFRANAYPDPGSVNGKPVAIGTDRPGEAGNLFSWVKRSPNHCEATSTTSGTRSMVIRCPAHAGISARTEVLAPALADSQRVVWS